MYKTLLTAPKYQCATRGAMYCDHPGTCAAEVGMPPERAIMMTDRIARHLLPHDILHAIRPGTVIPIPRGMNVRDAVEIHYGLKPPPRRLRPMPKPRVKVRAPSHPTSAFWMRDWRKEDWWINASRRPVHVG